MHKYKLFSHAICLCLDKRKEHWQALQKQSMSLGIDFTPFICGDGSDTTLEYNQIDDINPDVSRWGYGVPAHLHHHWNALKAHKGMIQMAKDKGFKSVLMMEDDCYLLERFDTIVSRIENNWLEYCETFPITYLGWWQGDENDDYNTTMEENFLNNQVISLEVINPQQPVGGLHSCIIRKQLYDFCLSVPMNNPMDSHLCQNRGSIPSLKVCPKATHIRSLYSFTEGAVFNRKDLK